MLYGSVCSGIEAASVAWEPLGWHPVYFAEIEPFPSAVLAHHWPSVPNRGDFTFIADDAPAIDVLVGGTPCQAFSLAGLRRSLADARGNLTLQFVRLVHAHASRPNEPLRWAVWENVPGVLSTKDNAFGCFLAGLVGGDDPLCVPGGGKWPDAGMVSGPLGRAAWRVLDAQHFGLAQRRRRVFVVFCPAASGGDPAAVLFERQGMPWDSAPGGEAGEGVAGGVDEGASQHCASVAPALTSSGRGVPRPGETRGQDPVVAVDAFGGGRQADSIDVATCLTAHHGRDDFESETFVAHTLRGEGFDASEDGTGRGTPLVPMTAWSIMPQNSGKDFKAREVEVAQPLMAAGPTTGNQGGDYIQSASAVRRLTPTECERLQGFPDGHTRIPMRRYAKRRITKNRPADMWERDAEGHWWLMAADGPRYKALGNSMAVEVMHWIGARIDAFERGILDAWQWSPGRWRVGGRWELAA
jgi:DNA (cytosine-5)-methyltransferase 1